MLDDSQWQALQQGFLLEAEELLQRTEQELGILQDSPADAEAINGLFRAIHTLKGSAGLLSLDSLVAFSHEFESVLMRVRDGELAADADLIHLAFRCADHLAGMLDALGREETPAEAPELLQALRGYLGGGLAPVEGPAVTREQRDGDGEGIWHLSLRFDPSLFQNGFDPGSFLRYLGRIARVLEVMVLDDALPESLQDFDPECCYLGLEIRLDQVGGREELESVFEFIRDLAQIRILPPRSCVADYMDLIQALPEDDLRLGEILVQIGALTRAELSQALERQQEEPERRLGEQLVDSGTVVPELVNAALDRQSKVRERKRSETSFVRVAADRLDALINQVGELVIAAAGARILAERSEDAVLRENLGEVHRHVEQIRETALQLRMVEIGETFQRFHRVVREAAQNLSKSIRLEISGADTDLDKTLVDRIYEPLVHLVRNAVDHGMESAAERQAQGKPAEGTVRLDAYHAAGAVVIEVRDDGRGIDLARVRAKAVERELIDADAQLEEQELLQLILHPGFSTAESVTNLSGRGVGMDSVKRDIDALRGSLEIDNDPGQGCCFRIRLPLTLAIIDGFLFSVGEQFFVVPLDAVAECVEIEGSRAQNGISGYRDLRGHALPFVDLRALFRVAGQGSQRQSLVVMRQGDDCAGVRVDRLHGELQTVIKPLGALFDHVPGLAGATILGSGEVALILDVASLLQLARQAKNPSFDDLQSPFAGVSSQRVLNSMEQKQ